LEKSLWEIRDYKVIKANDLIQKSRFNLTTQEQKIILYIISKIKPGDETFSEYVFEISEYCRVCGIDEDAGINYRDIKNSLQKLRDKSVWVEIAEGRETTLAWLSRATVDRGSGSVIVKIDDLMRPYLLFLRNCFTQYELLNIVAMRSKYSVRVYELLKSYEFRKEPIPFDLEDLKKTLFATQYQRFPDFRRKVLDIAMKEINLLTDIRASYTAKPTPGKGRGITTIVFHVVIKRNIDDRMTAWGNIEKRLEPKTSPNQVSIGQLALARLM
jgi:plasmid replication initiation protein